MGTTATYYEVLRPASQQDLEAAGPAAAAVLSKMPPVGYVAAADVKGRGARSAVSWACANGLLRRVRTADGVIRFGTVRFWLSQLSASKTTRVAGDGGTRHAYATALGAFDRWLRGREFRVGSGTDASRSFSDVEDLLGYCGESDRGARTANRIIRQHLVHAAAAGCALSTALVRCAAAKSYFAAHDIPVNVRVDRNRHRPGGADQYRRMTLMDVYKMMTSGGTDTMTKAILMVKFQAGLDSSTLADRFNYQAYGQITRHFGTDDYEAWDLDRCPVPIRLVRVKTNTRYTTFIDRDAVTHLRDYLRWREFRGNLRGPGEPLFTTGSGAPVTPHWVSRRFAAVAARAGIQARISRGSLRVRSHETRDLLKSTLVVAGCAPYAADHILGHAPRDSYEKQAVLYPEALRQEYAKASGMINIFAGIEGYLEAVPAAGGRPDILGPAVAAPAPGVAGPDIRDHLLETQASLRRVAWGLAEVLRVMLADRGGDAAEADGIRRAIRDLEAARPRGGG